jgi:hypothetical protein
VAPQHAPHARLGLQYGVGDGTVRVAAGRPRIVALPTTPSSAALEIHHPLTHGTLAYELFRCGVVACKPQPPVASRVVDSEAYLPH